MNRNYCRRFLALAVSAVGLFGLSCCEQGEIDDLREEVKRQDDRIVALENWQKSVNTDIQSLKAVLKGLESKDYVTGVTPLSDGSGYTLSFEKSGSVTIRHGEKGGKGDAPVISVKPGSDGRYYWTIDGGFLTDREGNKVPATGAPGSDGDTPYIGANGHWWIGAKDTGVKAQGAQGEPGAPGTPGRDGDTPYIGENGHWWIGIKDTGVNAQGAQGEPGKDGGTPYIGENGNWWIGPKDTGVKAQGAPGEPGASGSDGDTPYIGANGHWWIGTKDTGVEAQGEPGVPGTPGRDGDTPYIGANGHWWIGTKDTGVKAQGAQGEPGVPGTPGKDGLTPQLRINADTEEWEVSVDNGATWQSTGVKAAGKQGEPGDSWFKGIDVSRPDYVELTLADGTLLRLPRYAEMFVKFDGYEPFLCTETPCELPLVLPESLKENDYTALMATVVPADESTDIATRAAFGWGVKIVKPAFNKDGTLVPGSAKVRITQAPEPEAGRHTAMLKVTLIDAEGQEHSASRVVAVVKPVLVETAFGMELELALVDGGTFAMGATSEQGSDASDYEKPVHQVTLSDYYIGKYEVTQGQWEAVMGENPSRFKKGDDYPVEFVSWDDIQQFIQKLNEKTGKHYALPTEAQWEFAARGGNKSEGYKYSGGTDVDEVAWYSSNIPSHKPEDPGYGPQPVGAKASNELGLYDMSGNVWEWCGDWYGIYDADAQTDPQGPADGSSRVLRGGGYGGGTRGCRVSFRLYCAPDDRSIDLGFRLALLP